MTVTLRPLTKENWHECIRLQVTDEQKQYVASNLYSIAETRFEPTSVPLVIYAGDEGEEKMVVFVMYDSSDYYIARFMIDSRYQGKGYGRAAMQLLLEQFEREGAYPTATLSYVPGNEIAEHMYETAGFRKTGEMHDGEVVMARPLVIGRSDR
jgi:diamine N-acetyltransferase